MIHSVLLVGQSNMAGRGFASEVAPIVSDKIKVLRNGRWQNMYTPVNCDRPFSGVCLAESFAKRYSEEKGVTVGLIPCADGGTSIDQWQTGGLLFDHAVYQARLASRTSNIVAILWHQGESDCSAEKYPVYEEKLRVVLDELARQAGLTDVPILIGGLGDFLADCPHDKSLVNYGRINAALENIAATREMTGFVSAVGLGANPDNLHFNAASLREFGERYYEVFLTLEDKDRVYPEKSDADAAIRTSMELL